MNAERIVSSWLYAEIETACSLYRLSRSTVKAILILPIAIFIVYCLLLSVPLTRYQALWMLQESHPVEWATFALLLATAAYGVVLTLRARRHNEGLVLVGFYALFSAGAFFTAMEEVSWGQWIVGFETPESIKRINIQDEFNVHNLEMFGGHLEFVRILFGVGGLVGLWLSSLPSFRKIGVPRILVLWFLVITVHAAVDLYNDFIPIHEKADFYIDRLNELTELLIGGAGFLYLKLNTTMLAREWH